MILVKVMSTPVDDIEVEEGLEVGEELNLTPDPLPEVGNSKWEVLFEHHIHINSTATKTTKVKALNSFFFFLSIFKLPLEICYSIWEFLLRIDFISTLCSTSVIG